MFYLDPGLFNEFNKRFTEGVYSGQRKGQAFYDYFKLNKVTSDTDSMNRIYNVSDDEFNALFAKTFILE